MAQNDENLSYYDWCKQDSSRYWDGRMRVCRCGDQDVECHPQKTVKPDKSLNEALQIPEGSCGVENVNPIPITISLGEGKADPEELKIVVAHPPGKGKKQAFKIMDDDGAASIFFMQALIEDESNISKLERIFKANLEKFLSTLRKYSKEDQASEYKKDADAINSIIEDLKKNQLSMVDPIV